MELLSALVLGIVQGLTEFIPVSSSGHLVLAERFIHMPVSGFTFDAIINFGTLAALVIYFRHDIFAIIRDFIAGGEGRLLGWLIILATIPAVVAGVLLESISEQHFRSPVVVAAALLVVGIAMLFVERIATRRKALKQLTPSDSMTIGLAQILAFVPGVSRSGVTITAAMARGAKREAAARFSFLLSIPVLGGGALKVLLSSDTLSQLSQHIGFFAVGICSALVSGYLAIAFLLNYLRKHGLNLFGWYRIGLAIVVIVLILLR